MNSRKSLADQYLVIVAAVSSYWVCSIGLVFINKHLLEVGLLLWLLNWIALHFFIFCLQIFVIVKLGNLSRWLITFSSKHLFSLPGFNVSRHSFSVSFFQVCPLRFRSLYNSLPWPLITDLLGRYLILKLWLPIYLN